MPLALSQPAPTICSGDTDDAATGTKAVWPLCDLAEGEELSVNYMDDEFLLMPAPERRAKLAARREFRCECPRCSARGDDGRRFPCCATTGSSAAAAAIVSRAATKGRLSGSGKMPDLLLRRHCGGYHMAAIQESMVQESMVQESPQGNDQSPRQKETQDRSERLTECSECRGRASAAWADKMLRQEAETTEEVTRLKAIEASAKFPPDWLSLVRRLRPPHPHHRLAHDTGRLQWAPEYAHGEHAGAAKALERFIACLEAIFGPQRSCKLTAQHRHCAAVATLGIRSLSIHLPVTRPPDRASEGNS